MDREIGVGVFYVDILIDGPLNLDIHKDNGTDVCAYAHGSMYVQYI